MNALGPGFDRTIWTHSYKILLAGGITSFLAGHSIDLAKWQEINEIFLNFKLIQATPSTLENELQKYFSENV